MTYTISSQPGNWSYPTSIRFGNGRIAELPEVCLELGLSNPLLVTDPGISSLQMLQQATDHCKSKLDGCAVFADIQGNPVEENVRQGVEKFNSGSHDGVIAFGGGSALDVGKAIAFMSGQTRPIWDFEDREDWYTRADSSGIAPIIAVPTTSGTGSEVGRASVITDLGDETKKIIFHPRMMPACVILDPELTTGLPATLTAGVGMDALSHNLEAYCSPNFHPLAQGIATEGIRLIRDWLPKVCQNGQDLEARAQMQVASTMGATAFQKGLGAMHSLSHPCGSVFGTHHGTTNAVVMPYVLEYNAHVIEDKLTSLARLLDLPFPSPDELISWVIDLRAEIGIPNTLGELGIKQEHVTKLAPMALADPSTATNPVKMTQAGFEELYDKSITGKLDVQ